MAHWRYPTVSTLVRAEKRFGAEKLTDSAHFADFREGGQSALFIRIGAVIEHFLCVRA